MSSRWYRNKKSITTVPVEDRGFLYGDGLFETVAVRDGETRLWRLHVDRLAEGCSRLGFATPSESSMREVVAHALEQSFPTTQDGIVKIVLTARARERGYARADVTEVDVTIGTFAPRVPQRSAYRRGIDVIVCRTTLASPSSTAGLKTLNRLEQVLAASECRAAGVFEGLTCDADGKVICGTMSNVFIVSGQSIVTPSVSGCGVAGVMRRLVIESLAEQGTEVAVGEFTVAELEAADEVFLTNSQFGVLPVHRCGERRWTRHDRTRETMAVIAGKGIEECRL